MSKQSVGAPPLTSAMHHILMSLLRGDLHGYAIMQEVERLTDGGMRLGPGTLYTNLPKLAEAGLVEESAQRVAECDDERRRYYRLTGAGRAAVVEETRRLQKLVRYVGRHARLEA